MEISLEAIISFIGLFIGGTGIGSLFTIRYQRKKAKSEAEQAEKEAKKAEAEANQAAVQTAKDIQDTYDRMMKAQNEHFEEQQKYINEIREDRQHLRQERNEWRDRYNSLADEVDGLKRGQARQGRQLEAMRPFMCGDLSCKVRQRVTTSDPEALERTIHNNEHPQHDIEPLQEADL